MAMKPQYPEMLAVLREILAARELEPYELAMTKAKSLVAEHDACGEEPEEGTINVISGCTAEGKPFVRYEWSGKSHRCQFTPEEAQRHALGLIAAAEAAEMDSLVYLHLRQIGSTQDQAGKFIAGLRNYRAKAGRA